MNNYLLTQFSMKRTQQSQPLELIAPLLQHRLTLRSSSVFVWFFFVHVSFDLNCIVIYFILAGCLIKSVAGCVRSATAASVSVSVSVPVSAVIRSHAIIIQWRMKASVRGADTLSFDEVGVL